MKARDIWIVCFHNDFADWGLLAHCKSLCRSDETLAIVLGQGVSPETAAAHGANSVYLLDNAESPMVCGEQLAQMIHKSPPAAVFFCNDVYSRFAAASTAARLGAGLAADCTGIERRADGLFVMTRPAMGNGLMADIICPNVLPQMATVRMGSYPGVMIVENAAYPEVRRAEITACRQERVWLKDFCAIREKPLTAADVIVCGGLGIGSAQGFELLKCLAKRVGGSVGATRAAVNAGMAPYEYQIGLTGQTVAPKLYLALGVSGAVQHLVGMEHSGVIVAVNTDAKAPIIEYADYAVIVDWRSFAEDLLKRLN